MNDPSAALKRLGAALDSGDRDAVMGCFATDAILNVMYGEKRIAFTGTGIGEAVDALMSGFDDIKLTPNSRQVSASRVVEESVVSGQHKGTFADSPATSRRVHVNVKLSATAATDGSIKSLWVEADTRALFAQIAENNDAVGATGMLVATARERYDGAVRLIDGSKPLAKAAADAPPSSSGLRRRWPALAGAAAVVLVALLAWRPGSTGPTIDASANHPIKPTTSTSLPTSKPTKPPTKPPPKPVTKPVTKVLPVIATAPPKAVLHVQAGRQVVLRSDVLFAFDSAALTPAARAELTRVANQVRSAGVKGRIQINGYTDNLGGVAYDLALSRARALAVARVLQAGLAGRPVVLAPQGFGQANPVAANTTDTNRARNRRVTIVLPATR